MVFYEIRQLDSPLACALHPVVCFVGLHRRSLNSGRTWVFHFLVWATGPRVRSRMGCQTDP